MSAVRAQTLGFDTRVSSTCCTRYSPYSGGAAGCSHSASGGMIHDTAGSVPVATSVWNEAGYEGVNAREVSAAPVGVVGSL
jgi:hypothetical protein